ncbi:PREDICTED: receptor expression-enhancing protein 5-like [Nicrophorus vespilloides]|uniref:Receptor expression-enhancing protein n=1 Tax=Nicrophorus vespilloides TaxID=110193 RepID=A0ABM1MUY3_NICVS|nr:PREDICTED: receptor expression-enhancing protein 5-like [Nicrophorus vespilloides]
MAASIMEVKDQLDKSLHDESKPWGSVMGKVEAATGVNRTVIFLGVVVFIGLWLVFGYAGQLVCNLVGFVYPAYASMHAIESARTDDDKKWLTYWVVFAIFSLLEFFTDIITGWLPLYWFFKCIFMVWLMMPTELNGSIIIYNRIIRPKFLEHNGENANKVLTKEH